MRPNSQVHAAAYRIDHEPLASEQIRQGHPTAGIERLGRFDGLEVGIWEMTPGVASDVEAEELFVVLSGAATVEFDDGTAPLHLQPGDVVQLAAGAHTVWTVAETLRKVYLTGIQS